MIFFCIGFPGRFAEWCDDVIARLAKPSGGDVAIQTWPTYAEMFGFEPLSSALGAVGLTLIRDAPTHLVMGTRQPDERLLTAFSGAGVRYVLALDDPRLAVSEVIQHTAGELGLVTRAVANGCPLLMRFASLPGALALHADRARTDVGETVFAIARHIGCGLGDDQIAQIIDDVAATELTRALVAGDRSSPAIAHQQHRIIDGALSCYAEQFAGGGGFGRIVWQRELFLLFVEGFHRPTGVIDVAGPPRPLIIGPYIHLPLGRWTARVVLGVSPDAVGNTFLVDAVTDSGQLGITVLVPDRGGVHVADVEFSVDEPSPRGIEIRVLVSNENAHGRVAFGHVVLQPLSAGQPAESGGSENFEAVFEL